MKELIMLFALGLLLLSSNSYSGTLRQKRSSNYLKLECLEKENTKCLKYQLFKKENGNYFRAIANRDEMPNQARMRKSFCKSFLCNGKTGQVSRGTRLGLLLPLYLRDEFNAPFGGIVMISTMAIGLPLGIAFDVLRLPISGTTHLWTTIFNNRFNQAMTGLYQPRGEAKLKGRCYKRIANWYQNLRWKKL